MLKKNLVIYMILVPLLLLNVSATPVRATETTSLKVEPQTITIGPPIPTDSFIVNITVNDVADLFIWQVKIFYNTTILNCTGASLPPYHFFAGKAYQGPNIAMEANYVLVGATLLGTEPAGVSGTGVICQIEFKGIAEGTSHLNFSEPYGEDTFLWDSNLDEIPDSMINGSVTVIPEFSSFMVIPLFIIATIAAVYLTTKRPLKKR